MGFYWLYKGYCITPMTLYNTKGGGGRGRSGHCIGNLISSVTLLGPGKQEITNLSIKEQTYWWVLIKRILIINISCIYIVFCVKINRLSGK